MTYILFHSRQVSHCTSSFHMVQETGENLKPPSLKHSKRLLCPPGRKKLHEAHHQQYIVPWYVLHPLDDPILGLHTRTNAIKTRIYQIKVKNTKCINSVNCLERLPPLLQQLGTAPALLCLLSGFPSCIPQQCWRQWQDTTKEIERELFHRT